MSDQRPEWMPEEQVILMIQDGEYIDGEIDDAFCKTGLRAQLAVLQEMNKCLTYKHLGNAITDKLIALRKDLEHG